MVTEEEVKKVAPDEKQELTEIEAPTQTNEMSSNKKQSSKVRWYLAPAFLIFWIALFFAVVVPVFLSLPDGLTTVDENTSSGEFIAERAQDILTNFDHIGPKVVGSHANENITVEFLYNELKKIKKVLLDDYFKMDIDFQVVSGAYVNWAMVNMYQGVQNIVVRLRPKESTSESYLLINSHFDSKPGSPGAGDDGAMVVIMLEVLRVLATTPQSFTHPIIFLFNGAEENPLQASHGFITQHKWAKNCKALINLDSAGSGNREILFQSGPNHPWLTNIYRKTVKRAYATTFAEELFQSGIIPSDTDFRIFKIFGQIPGLDLAHSYNGYVYHTKFDRSEIIPLGTLQTTGDNILAMARAFVNSTELENPSLYANGHVVFYDILSYFVVYYTEATAKTLNIGISAVALVLVAITLWYIAANSFVSICDILRLFGLIVLLHLLGLILAFGLPLLIAVIYDSVDLPMTWFSSKWLVFGLYISPSLFGLAAPTLLYLSLSRNDKVTHSYRLQMVGHAHTLLLSVLCIALTLLGIRSTYFAMISILFYAGSLLINLLTTLYRRAYYWSIFVILGQIMPFLYFSYLFNALINSLMPMMGRFGSGTNPDLIIAALNILAAILSLGYLIQLLNIFSRPKLVILILPIVTIIFVAISLTSIGYPYRPKTNVQRINVIESHRIFYEYDGSVSRNESGYYFDWQDRRKHLPLVSSVDLTGLYYVNADCDVYLACGLPIYNHRNYKARKLAAWLPREQVLKLPGTSRLTLLNKTINDNGKSIRFEFELEGPSHMSIFIEPYEDVTVSDWSFLTDMLENRDTYQPPYYIYFSYGKLNTPLKFFIDLEKGDGNFDVPLMQLAIVAHYIDAEYERDEESKKFLASLPPYSYAMEWPGSYERFIF